MQLSTKGRYAVMAMVDLAQHGGSRPLSLAEIAAHQDLPLPYLEQLFLKLRRAGLVRAMRGPGGGYNLARGADRITICEIMLAVDEPVKMTRCASEEAAGCVRDHRCATHDLWRALGEQIVAFLHSVTLRDVMDGALAAPPFMVSTVTGSEAYRSGAAPQPAVTK